MNAATITAICAGAVSVIGSVVALIRVLQHASDPNAHEVKTDETSQGSTVQEKPHG